jgi:hypothetical protein
MGVSTHRVCRILRHRAAAHRPSTTGAGDASLALVADRPHRRRVSLSTIGNTSPVGVNIEDFCRNGYTHIESAVDADLVGLCRDAVWTSLESSGVERATSSTWIEPVVRVRCLDDALISAERSSELIESYDALVGLGRWIQPGTPGDVIPVRFPSERQPADLGWHVDGNWKGPNEFHLDIRSTGRGLTAFILLTDVDLDDAPTAMIPGSHLAVPSVLEPYGAGGLGGNALVGALHPAVLCRRMTFAVGKAGDAYLCHPFLVHTATWPHRGDQPRMMVVVKLEMDGGFILDGSDSSPVASSIVAGLSV